MDDGGTYFCTLGSLSVCFCMLGILSDMLCTLGTVTVGGKVMLGMTGSGWGLFMETIMSSFGLTQLEKMLLSWSNALRVMVSDGGKREL